MPSKRTNDSVDRILEDLNMQQTAAGVRDSVTDHQVDEILRSVGITPPSSTPLPQSDFAFLEDEMPAPAPQPRPAAVAQRPAPQQEPRRRETLAQPAPRPVQPVQQVTQTSDTAPVGYNGDTTRTGIIKGFLRKMAPADGVVDTDALNQGKDQFKNFFEKSVAVVPDEKGRMPRETSKKKRGLFGLKPAEDTDEFVPINVSLGGSPAASAKDDWSDEEAELDRREEAQAYEQERTPAPARPASHGKKQGFLGNLFGGSEDETEELMIPEARAEEPTQHTRTASPVQAAQEDTTREVWRSKYTRSARAAQPAPRAGDTLEMVRGTVAPAVSQAQTRPVGTDASGMTGTVYRKKKNTVEFTPGQKIHTAPPPAPQPRRSEPVGEPVQVPNQSPATGFTMQIDALDVAPLDSTQDFMRAYNVVRPQRPAAQPAAPAQKQQEPPQPQDDTVLFRGPAIGPDRPRDEVDTLVDTLTGRVRLTLESPAHSGFTQNLGTVPAQSSAPQPAAPAHSGFTQDLAHAPQEPATSAFVENIVDAINTQPVEPEARFQEAAARLTGPEENAPEAASRPRKGMAARLTGKPEDEYEDNAAPAFETTEIPVPHAHEYERAEDAPAVRAALDKQLMAATLACIVSGVVAAVLIVLGIMASALPVLPGPLADSTVYTAVALILLLAACGVNWQTFVSGLRGMAKPSTPDSLSVLPALGAVIQCIVLLITRQDTVALPILAGPAALVLCLNAAGKRMNAATVSDNFRLVSAKVEHAVAYRLMDAGALKAVTRGLAEPHPGVLVSRPTQIFRSFLTNSAAHGTSDKNQQQFARILGGCGLAAMLFTLIRTKDIATAVTVMTGVFCLAAPLAGTLLSALPARLMQRSAAQVGAVIPGWRDIRQLGRINVIQVTARDLFPVGCVSLAGIKPVKPEHIDTAIVYAASILAEAGPTLRDVFLDMLGRNTDLLAKVEERETVYGKGYVGWINKRRVLVGNRALMQDYGVKIPSLEYEHHHTVNQRRVIYLAVSGKLFAMFQVSYQRDEDTAAVLETLRRAGLSLVVDCDDFNCDVSLLETAYSLPAGAVKVLTADEHAAMAPAVAWLPESEGSMLHLGSFASFVGGLEAAAGAAEGEHRAAIVLTVSVLLSCVLGVLLTLTGGLITLPMAGLVLYQAAWCVLALVFPLLQRY